MKMNERLKQAFPLATICKYATTTDAGVAAGLTPKVRWLYSRMLYRYGPKMAVSQRKLSLATGLHRTTTLPHALNTLVRIGLVAKVEKKYRAILPTGERREWFRWYDVPNGHKRLSYNWAAYIRGQDIIDGLVRASDFKRRYSASLLAARFGVCRQTITAARKRLARIGLDRPSKVKDNPVVEALKPEPKEPQMTAVEQQTIQQTIKAFELQGLQGASNAERLAHQHGITEPDTVAVLSRVTATVFKGLAYKEQSQIVGSLVKRFGNGEGLEDYLYGKLPAWTVKYGSGILSVESFLQAT